MRELLERRFRLQENQTTASREVVGGVTTFLTMSYIIFVQLGVLSQAGMDFQAGLCPSSVVIVLTGGTVR